MGTQLSKWSKLRSLKNRNRNRKPEQEGKKNDNKNVANINEKIEKGVISKNVIDQREKKSRNW